MRMEIRKNKNSAFLCKHLQWTINTKSRETHEYTSDYEVGLQLMYGNYYTQFTTKDIQDNTHNVRTVNLENCVILHNKCANVAEYLAATDLGGCSVAWRMHKLAH